MALHWRVVVSDSLAFRMGQVGDKCQQSESPWTNDKNPIHKWNTNQNRYSRGRRNHHRHPLPVYLQNWLLWDYVAKESHLLSIYSWITLFFGPFSFSFLLIDKSYELRYKTSVNKHITILTLAAPHSCTDCHRFRYNNALALFLVKENWCLSSLILSNILLSLALHSERQT